ncbi:hypothetical protein B0F90DRAFT_1819250 [Multifurca ochricompacta]|uniref:PHD-type domain-containing protein n=1 Tax=Multifurca ochricompacta TaxID=376703 RepID=A0AAD4M2N3_9AGAM|nr:hypothetical protein B0F90DRAFT_1819250 [Multifurca ochricompacta]
MTLSPSDLEDLDFELTPATTFSEPIVEPQQATPALGPTDLPCLSPFGRSTTHLPTPQSPSYTGPYLNGKTDLPLLNGATSPCRSPGESARTSAQRQILTPDSSPVAARKWALHEGDTTPTKKWAPIPAQDPTKDAVAAGSPVSSTRLYSLPPLKVLQGTLESGTFRGCPSACQSLTANSPGLSTLSSPFMQKASSATPPRRPTSPSPARPSGAEIDRIQADDASTCAVQQRWAEAQRPDYMRRITRSDEHKSADMPGLGIAETPVKGRRIELWGFQETSEESFEERLMAGGSVSTAAQEVAPLSDPIDEREARKRRRLEAFRRVHTRVQTSLHPVEVEGKGRVLLDASAEEVSELLDELQSSTAGKRRGAKKRRRGGPGSRGGKTRAVREETRPPRIRECAPLAWPDEEFPWNIRTHERRELEAAEEADRMQWIGRFLDEDSDAESSGSLQDDDLPGSPPTQQGRGKMGLLPSRKGPKSQKIFVPSDPADARAALLSKQSVRALAARRKLDVKPSADGDGEEILCICRGKDDGRELVQCDDCRTWYHLECLGIKGIADLGREEDPWYCHNCVTLMNELSTSEPTFVPAEEEIPLRRRRDPLFFEALQESPPGNDWRIPLHGPGPTTPKANTARVAVAEVSTRSSLGSRNGPYTPRNSSVTAEHVRVYTTPDTDERIFQDDVSPFDPTSTPSRGVRVGASVSSVFATPKWQIHVPPTYTPSPYRNSIDAGGGVSSSSPYRVFPHEDTPVDRSVLRPSASLPSKRLQESPLRGRGGVIRGHPHMQGSPVPLGKKGKERQGAGRR